MAWRCLVILFAKTTNDGSCDRRAQDNQRSRASLPCFDGEHVAEAFFEEVGPPQSRVGLSDPVELMAVR